VLLVIVVSFSLVVGACVLLPLAALVSNTTASKCSNKNVTVRAENDPTFSTLEQTVVYSMK
jgi:hypothetical protein